MTIKKNKYFLENIDLYFYLILVMALISIVLLFPTGYVLARLYYDPFYYIEAANSLYNSGNINFEIIKGYGYVNYQIYNGIFYTPIFIFNSIENKILTSQIINIIAYIFFISSFFLYLKNKSKEYFLMIVILIFSILDYKYNHSIIFPNSDLMPSALTILAIYYCNKLWNENSKRDFKK